MQFLITATDGTDEGVSDRRMATREAHVRLVDELKAQNKLLIGGAILNDAGTMVGSMLVGNFVDRAELDTWLAREPYVQHQVWATIDVKPLSLGPSFQNML